MKKFDAHQGLAFGLIMTIAYLIQNVWTADTLTSTVILRSVIGSLIAGALAGVLYGLFIGWYKASKYNTSRKKEVNEGGENGREG